MACNSLKSTIFLAAILACSLSYNASARPLPNSSTLVARLKLDEESPTCWDSLLQLQACTGEIILFFLNGETYLGSSCCHAIRTITQQCWPDLIDTLGFTNEEGDVLEGYCDKSTVPKSPPLPPPPPPAAVVPNVVA